MRPVDRLQDVRIPADAADQLTTNAKSALPPADFNVVRNGATNLVTVRDRTAVQGRSSTAAYRVYFLPEAYAPQSTGTTTTVPRPALLNAVGRLASRKAATLLTEIAAPGLGTVLSYNDATYVATKGYYFCVAVNQSGVEAPVEHVIPTDSLLESPLQDGSEMGATIVSSSALLPSLNGITLGAVTLVAGPNVTITPAFPTANDITIESTGGSAGNDMTFLLMGA